MTGSEIRRRFLEYFRERGHEVVASSSLVPLKDPTLLFANAGMNQFKEYFLGLEQRPYNRAVTSQKCVRAGGKHNDLENVGYTARHHTFFEMLGNFSFGDYFKREAILYAWEFLTSEMGLPGEKLYATVYKDDDEAAELWRTLIALPPERIVRLGEKDNFWSMGDTGPCGPCSEIVIDRGEAFRCSDPRCGIDTCGCDRWLELWNLVFMQYNRDSSGMLTPLPRPSIDTGLGLERITAVVQDVPTNFDTDLFMPVISLVSCLSDKPYNTGEVPVFPFRIIADHGRSCTFLVTDGVVPSNEGRGYVLRRILRRAVRYGKALGIERPFMHEIVPVVARMMGDVYPEIQEKAAFTAKVIRLEEERFRETLSEGTKRVEELVRESLANGLDHIRGRDAFMLYDTYGFPIDLTQDIARDAGLSVDRSAFDEAMEEQRRRARASRRVEGPEAMAMLSAEIQGIPNTRFTGCSSLDTEATVLAIVVDNKRHPRAAEGEHIGVITDATPFYAESGGQVGDTGTLIWDGGLMQVLTAQHISEGRILHSGVITRGGLSEGQPARLVVEPGLRHATQRNHSATHLLHKALKQVLGEHVNQAGSLVSPDRLRFDFTHFAALSETELEQIEDIVNSHILRNLPVSAEILSMDEAKARGAVALFGEKYGNEVRVIQMGDYSMELCGGTHVQNTGEIGLFKVVSEQSVGAGLRRIEAVTGAGALQYLRRLEAVLRESAALLKCSVEDIPAKIADLSQRMKEQSKQIQTLTLEGIRLKADAIAQSAVSFEGIRIAASEVKDMEVDSIRTLGDMIRDRLGPGVVVLGQASGDRVNIVIMASKDAVAKGVHAGNIAKTASAVVGGSGGGRPDMAQAGGKNTAKLTKAMDVAVDAIKRSLSA